MPRIFHHLSNTVQESLAHSPLEHPGANTGQAGLPENPETRLVRCSDMKDKINTQKHPFARAISLSDHLLMTYNQMIVDMEIGLRQYPTSVQLALDCSRLRAVRSGVVNQEEVDEIAHIIKHDINDAADTLMEHNEECHDWLLDGIETIERKVMEKYLASARTTRQIMHRLQRRK